MSIVAYILNRMNVLEVTFRDAAAYDVQLTACRWRRGAVAGEPVAEGKDADEVLRLCTSAPVLVMATGYGVIVKSREAAPDVVAKVTAPESGFRWNERDGLVAFMRGEQLDPVLTQLAGARVLGVCIGGGDAEECAERYYKEEMKLKRALRPTPGGSALASLLARRLQMPVLCTLLALLAANALVSPRIRNRWQAAQTEKAALEKRQGQADDSSRERAQAVAEWGRTLPHGFAWLCDRAASALPDDVTLTSLSVQPLLKNIEEGRKPAFSEREMVIAGRTARSESVSQYAAALGELGMARQVRLASVEHDREKGVYNFRINLEL